MRPFHDPLTATFLIAVLLTHPTGATEPAAELPSAVPAGQAGQTTGELPAAVPVALVGETWKLEAYNTAQQTLVPPLAGTDINLELRAAGTLGGSDGCNRYLSGYRLDRDSLTIGPIATTRLRCTGPETVAAQAAAYAKALGTVARYRIAGRTLLLQNADGKTVAQFRAAAPARQAE